MNLLQKLPWWFPGKNRRSLFDRKSTKELYSRRSSDVTLKDLREDVNQKFSRLEQTIAELRTHGK